MQLIQLDLDNWNFFCPATGRPVYREDGEPNTPTFRGGWCDEVPEEPLDLAEELRPLWNAHLEAQEAADEGADVAAFLQSIERPNWVAFEITTRGMACGPVWSTAWTVLDLNAVDQDSEG